MAGKTFLQCGISMCCFTSKQLTQRGHCTIDSKCLIWRKNTGNLPRCPTPLSLRLQKVTGKRKTAGGWTHWRTGVKQGRAQGRNLAGLGDDRVFRDGSSVTFHDPAQQNLRPTPHVHLVICHQQAFPEYPKPTKYLGQMVWG